MTREVTRAVLQEHGHLLIFKCLVRLRVWRSFASLWCPFPAICLVLIELLWLPCYWRPWFPLLSLKIDACDYPVPADRHTSPCRVPIASLPINSHSLTSTTAPIVPPILYLPPGRRMIIAPQCLIDDVCWVRQEKISYLPVRVLIWFLWQMAECIKTPGLGGPHFIFEIAYYRIFLILRLIVLPSMRLNSIDGLDLVSGVSYYLVTMGIVVSYFFSTSPPPFLTMTDLSSWLRPLQVFPFNYHPAISIWEHTASALFIDLWFLGFVPCKAWKWQLLRVAPILSPSWSAYLPLAIIRRTPFVKIYKRTGIAPTYTTDLFCFDYEPKTEKNWLKRCNSKNEPRLRCA